MRAMLAAYRATGADPLFGDPRAAHGTPLEGYYWRFTDPAREEVLVALCGVSRDREGHGWGTVALAHHPTGAVASASTPEASADPGRLGAVAGDVLRGDARRLHVDLGPDAGLEAELHDVVAWPHRAWGGVGLGHLVPGLSQYWLPWCLAARVTGSARIGGRAVPLDGAVAYAEKNWGHGFPPDWWWGQAHGFGDDPEVCAAFAGGVLRVGPARPRATALVVRLGSRVLRRGEPVVNGVRAELGDGSWRLRGGGIELVGSAAHDEGCVLPVPLPAERREVAGARQHLAGTIELTVRRRGRLVYRGTSRLAGLERGRGLSSLAPWPSQTPPSSPTSTPSSPAPSPRTSAPAT
ncbi:MAG: hypothetical protein QOH43_4302 [Solirubrobacteraceae bacterium]|jgi:hypothetical protein|nr:hypothetical protein [Solirubrobacteraceae bacterium]